MILRAPAKLNLGLYLGHRREGGVHELASLFCPLTLSDRISVTESATGADEMVCPGVDGPNLAAAALAALRERGWERPPLRVEIEKRIPVAAGLGGGSADAGAILRLAVGEVEGLEAVAAALGADVPSQLEPGFALVRGAGEVVEPLPPPGEFAVVLVPAERGLATADVFAEADRLGIGRSRGDLDAASARLRDAALGGASPLDFADLLENDLAEAALSLLPEIRGALEALDRVGAARALLTGSGPAVYGLFPDFAAADRAAGALPPRFAGALVAGPETAA